MNLTDYSELAILKHTLGVTEFAMPTPYVALCADIGSTLESTTPTEPTGNGYARQSATFQIVGATANNSDAVSHVATGDWGTIKSMAIADAVSAGNILFWGDLLDIDGNSHTLDIDSEEHRFEIAGINANISGNTSDWLSVQMLQHLLGISEFVMPDEHWIAVFGDDTNLQSGEGAFTEPTTGGYIRQSCQFNADGTLKNQVDFTMATATWNEKAKYIGVMTAETGGNLLFYEEVESEREVKTGGQLWFPANTGLIFELD